MNVKAHIDNCFIPIATAFSGHTQQRDRKEGEPRERQRQREMRAWLFLLFLLLVLLLFFSMCRRLALSSTAGAPPKDLLRAPMREVKNPSKSSDVF